ncbi:MAG: DUF3300 domain-containing protein [Phycisphaerales bacterium]
MNRLPSLTAVLSLSLLLAPGAFAQTPAPSSSAAPAGDAQKLSPEQLDQLVAPIALYPDELLSQVLMASTYPLEIVQADRWVKANSSLKGDALAKALEQQTWDPSVKSLVNFPDVLSMMSEKLDITSKLGDAFISQQKDVMDSVQRLRAKAKAAGNLQSNQQQTVIINQAPAGSATPQTIVIQPAQPQVVYVPTYNPTVVYGAWPYPAYPPYPYYPPGYVASNVLSFGVGVACGVAWGYAWGNCNWNHGNVNVNINQNINYNNQINRNNYQNNFNRNNANFNNGQGQWQHNPQHRQGVPYNNRATAQQYGGVDRAQATQAREQFRGRENSPQGAFGDSGRGLNRDNVGQNRNPGSGAGNNAGNRDMSNRPNAGTRDNSQLQNRAADRGNAGAFSGVDRGNATRDASNRGNASRTGGGQVSRPSGGGSQMSRPSGGGGQMSRPAGGGGGGARGGGGRR